ncbi:hypothetical protein KC19_6G164400 [Ceratodon purpureus]|uniref:Pseudouridine synthase RsuA/RluA-like domain-containing protein n=1 Tax=Ceratodon purpureus TaxID=3225 RepID=A0A8T0HH65_CERPU|nr:hypothetical protein KC19_6G164400 [Ceratodon purpureus]
MATTRLRPSDGQVEAVVEAQVAADLNITWETPSTPAHPDDYVIVNGTRMVRPYFFEFLAHVKRRWAGKTVVDLFAQEFRQRPREYYEEAVKLGRIRVEGKIVAPSYVVRDSETMSHFVHRHEPPVFAGAVTVLEEGPDVITVCKPASVPVHPCGQYRKNTVMSILEAERKTGQLFPVHRLDRLVSGLLILARNSRTADFFRQEIEAGVVQKQYVAKVKGVFPAEEVELNAAVLYDPREGRSSVEVRAPAEDIVAEMEPALQKASRKSPENDTKGKESCTRFQRLSTNGVDSIVRCMPQTGRTHQIRVHLQHLGFPIANDALYLHSNVAKRSKSNTTADRAAKLPEASETLSRVKETSCTSLSTGSVEGTINDAELGSKRSTALGADATNISQGDAIFDKEQEQHDKLQKTNENVDCKISLVVEQSDPSESTAVAFRETDPVCPVREDDGSQDISKITNTNFVVDPLCTHCPNLEPSGYIGDDDGLWLHCIRYSGTNWAYECPLPEWAL